MISPNIAGGCSISGGVCLFAVSCVEINIHTSTLLHQSLLISSEFYRLFLGYLYILNYRFSKP